MSWWRQNWRIGVGLIAAGLGCIVVLVLWIMRRGKEAEELRAKLAMMTTTLKVAGLEADRDAREGELKRNSMEAAKLDSRIIQAKKDTVAKVQSVKEMSDAEVIEAFKKLGY